MGCVTPSALDDLGLGALALLRTAACMYGLLVVVAAATAPVGAPPAVAAGLLLPLSPLVLTAVARSLLAARGRELRVAPFAVAAFGAGATLMATRLAMEPSGLGDLVIAVTGVVVSAVAISALADGPAEARGEPTRAG